MCLPARPPFPPTGHLLPPTSAPSRLSPACLCSYNAINGEHQAIAAELEKAQGEFREFERKDIKYRWGPRP